MQGVVPTDALQWPLQHAPLYSAHVKQSLHDDPQYMLCKTLHINFESALRTLSSIGTSQTGGRSGDLDA